MGAARPCSARPPCLSSLCVPKSASAGFPRLSTLHVLLWMTPHGDGGVPGTAGVKQHPWPLRTRCQHDLLSPRVTSSSVSRQGALKLGAVMKRAAWREHWIGVPGSDWVPAPRPTSLVCILISGATLCQRNLAGGSPSFQRSPHVRSCPHFP